ncbi:MAG TPA: GWxTD domain-containing protein [Bacteroidota bacterium]|nr:GWxTD domain-containing protein [Bacteroidota bacterium]
MRHRIVTYYFFCILLTTQFAFSQGRRDQFPGSVRFPAEIAIQTVNLVSQVQGRSRLDIAYRIPRTFFVFTRDVDSPAPQHFSANGEIIVEVLDSGKNSVAQTVIKKQLDSDIMPAAQDSSTVEGAVTFDLLPGKYSLALEIDDHNSNRKTRDLSRTITLKDFSRGDLEASDVVFLDPQHGGETTLEPYNLGGDVPFSQNTKCYVQASTTIAAESLVIAYRIVETLPDEKMPRAVMNDTIRGTFRAAKDPVIQKIENSFIYGEVSTLPSHVYTCSFDVMTDTLPVGMYRLDMELLAGNQSASIKKNFQVRWESMPATLRQIRLAVDAMQYVLSEDEGSKLESASAKKQRMMIDDFWKPRDPSPHTAFNEVMTEYFHRADYAYSNFGTLPEPNGLRSERAKAYILYGPPASIERKLVPSSDPQEIWLYPNLQKKLVFVDEHHNGNYKLVIAE